MIFKNLLPFNSLTHEMQGGMKYGFLFIDLSKVAIGYEIHLDSAEISTVACNVCFPLQKISVAALISSCKTIKLG